MKNYQRAIYFSVFFAAVALTVFNFKYRGFPEETNGHFFIREYASPVRSIEVSKFVYSLRCVSTESVLVLTLALLLVPSVARRLDSRKIRMSDSK